MIFLAGHHASGKTEAAKILQREYGFLHVETSAIVKGHKAAYAPDVPMSQWVNDIQKDHGTDYLDRLIVHQIRSELIEKQVQDNLIPELVVTGNRSISGVNHLIQDLSGCTLLPKKESIIVGLVAPEQVLFQRYIQRDREYGDRSLTPETFQLVLEDEKGSGLDELLDIADFSIKNDGNSQQVLAEKVHNLFGETLGFEVQSVQKVEEFMGLNGHELPNSSRSRL